MLSRVKKSNSAEGYQARDGAEPIPHNTPVVCVIEDIKWEGNSQQSVDQGLGEEIIKIMWRVVEGEYDRRVMFQKLYVLADEDERAEQALEALGAIDAICFGGSLAALPNDPEDSDFAKGLGKRALITARVRKYKDNTGQMASTNFVGGVQPLGAASAGRSRGDTETASSAPAGGRERRARR
jgi:hypothetical protein